jgi:hypothetical protein
MPHPKSLCQNKQCIFFLPKQSNAFHLPRADLTMGLVPTYYPLQSNQFTPSSGLRTFSFDSNLPVKQAEVRTSQKIRTLPSKIP